MLIDSIEERGILIIDDELTVVRTLEQTFSTAGFKNIFTANDGVPGLLRVKECGERIYVICLDIKMPHMDGLEFFRQLAMNVDFPIGVVAISAFMNFSNIKEFLATATESAMAIKTISKPWDRKELLVEINRAMEMVHSRRLRSATSVDAALYSAFSDQRISINKMTTEVQTGMDSMQGHFQQLLSLPGKVDKLQLELERLRENKKGFIFDLGMDVVRAAILAVAIVGVLYLGVGDFLKTAFGNLFNAK